MKPYTYGTKTPYGSKQRAANEQLARTGCENARNLSKTYNSAMSEYVRQRIAAMRAGSQGQPPANPINPTDDK